MLSSHTRTPRSLAALVCAACAVGFPTIALAGVDGTVDAGEYNLSLAVQNTPTGFGDNQSELDQALGRLNADGSFQLGLTGNLEGNNNGIVIFLDSKSGGAVASTTAGGYGVIGSVGGARTDDWGTDTDGSDAISPTPGGGSVLSPGFNPDYSLEMNDSGGTNYYINVIDMTVPNEPNPNRDIFLPDPADNTRSGLVNSGSAVTSSYLRDDGATNAGDVTHAFNNTNTAGVNGTGDPNGLGDPLSATTGYELLFSSQFLNADPGQEIKLLAFITNGDGGFLSNQFLPGLPGGTFGNLAGPGGDGGTALFDAENGLGSPQPNFFITVPLPEWQGGTANGWSDDANWLVANPDGVNTTAKFAAAGSANPNVNVDVNKTLGGMIFDGGANYTLSGAGSITLDAFAGKIARINVVSGNPTIGVPVAVNHDLRITVADVANTLNLSGPITYAAGVSLTKDGAGQAIVQNVRVDGLYVADGALKIGSHATANDPSGTSVVKTLAIGAAATLDLTNNSMIIDYTDPVGTLVDDTRLMLKNNQLTSSSADANHRIGYLDNATRGLATFSGQSVDSSSILIKFTFGGDANLDGQVDVTDLGALATNWQTSNVWAGGDFNYDGFVDVTDLGILATDWQLGVGSPLGPGSLQAALQSVGLGNVSVPEPASIAAIGLCLAAAASRRRRGRARLA